MKDKQSWNKLMKKGVALFAGLSMVIALSSCGLQAPDEGAATGGGTTGESTEEGSGGSETTTPGAGAEKTLVFAEVNPLDTIVGQMDQAFADKVEELSGGKLHIDIQASGILGSESDVLDSILGGGGTIQMSRISAFALTQYGGQKSSLLSIPFTFKDRDHFWAFADSDLAEEFLMEPYNSGTGIRGLFYGEEGFRHFFFVNDVTDIAGLQGLKLRVSNDPVMQGMVENLGASPTVVSMGELYSALQTGVVDGAEQPIANYKANAFNEVAPYLLLSGHTLGAVQVIIEEDTWESLTEEEQGWITEAGKYASESNRKNSQEMEDKVLQELKDAGVTVTEVTDQTPWREACAPTIESASAFDPDLYQKLLDIAQ